MILLDRTDDGINASYAMKTSGQSTVTRQIFPQMMIFSCSICIGSSILRSVFHSAISIMQSSYQLCLNHSKFLYTEWKSLNFFSTYLLEIDQAQRKNSNYDTLLSAWLVPMEICSEGIFISIWLLPAQIKIHKFRTLSNI